MDLFPDQRLVAPVRFDRAESTPSKRSSSTAPTTNEMISPKQQHHDDYACFGDYFILTSRCVRSIDGEETHTQEFRLTAIALLD